MLGKLLKVIFLPKGTRERLEAQKRAPGRGSGRATPGKPQVVAGRNRLLDEAMTIYRSQRKEYESLDEETRRRIETDAAELFGKDMVEPKR